MYMNDRVGVGELRQNLSKYLRRVEKGERLLVTDRNKPVAELGPPLSSLSHVDRLIAEGKANPPRRPRKPGEPFPEAVELFGGVDHEGRVTRALEEMRGKQAVEAVYADASALVKLVVKESQTEAVEAFAADVELVSSELARAEVPRALRRIVSEDRAVSAEDALLRGEELLDEITLAPVERFTLEAGGEIPVPGLRTLDAIHVITAIYLGPIDAFLTYDARQAAFARLAGLNTLAPGT